MDKQRTYPFLPDDACLTEQQLFDYIDGKLTAPEMHRAEKHLLDCELCSDALEGFEKVKQREKVGAFSPNKISPQQEKDDEPKVIPIRSNRRSLYAIAAAIVLILGITVVMRMNLSDEKPSAKMAENNSAKTDAVVTPEKQQNFIATDSTSTNLDDGKVDNKTLVGTDAANGNANGGAPNVQGASPEPLREMDKAKMAPATADGPPPQVDQYSLSQTTSTPPAATKDQQNTVTYFDLDKTQDDEVAIPDNVSSGRAENQPAADSKVTSKNEKKDGAGVFHRNADSGAVAKSSNTTSPVPAAQNQSVGGVSNAPVEEDENIGYVVGDTARVLTESQINPDYQQGVKLLDAGKAAESLVYFDKVLSDPKNKNFEDAQWKKSIALLQLNRKDEAKVLLNDIVKKNGKYKTEATNKLKSL